MVQPTSTTNFGVKIPELQGSALTQLLAAMPLSYLQLLVISHSPPLGHVRHAARCMACVKGRSIQAGCFPCSMPCVKCLLIQVICVSREWGGRPFLGGGGGKPS